MDLEQIAKLASKQTVVERKPYIPAGVSGKLIVTKADAISGHKGNFFVFEFLVEQLESISEGAEVPKEGSPLVYLVNMDAKNNMGHQNVKRVANALAGKDISSEQEMINTLRGAVGRQVSVQTFRKVSKADKPYTDILFAHVAQTEDEVKETRKALSL